ncbi:hypothetical protein PVAP13_7KG075500 [Panicum virgatum]|uniref:BLE2 protein n=1 Tax=Panicum virgatum TaxID=38727 RepID=A0A8T0Q901_PANVG|nr:hypothetical protein PVAP13_7KG075500 [Panicum virgatum]
MESAAAGTTSNVPPEERRLPEARINHVIILRSAFIDKAISGMGKLALAWATTVLLGGFSTLLKQKDFLFVIIITFLKATSLFSSAVDVEDTFILNAPEAVTAQAEKFEAMEHGSWERHRTNPERGTAGLGAATESLLTSRRCYTCWIFFVLILLSGFTLAQFATGFTSIVLAALRLSRQDYVETAHQGSSDHKSIRGSLNLFYGLVLAQGLSSLLAYTMIATDVQQVLKLSMTYQLGSSGVQIIKRYMLDTYMKCSGGSVREAMNMDMVSFAMEMVRSNSVADRLVGVRILDRILSVHKYRGLALMRLRASSDTVATVVSMLGLKNKTREEENTRGYAANVVLWLSPDLLVESFPGALHMVSSLLTLKTTTTAMAQRSPQQSSSNVSIELTWLGVKILNTIMDNPDNCKKVTDADDHVMSSIVDLTEAVSDDGSSISWSPVIEEIIEEAVQVLHKLVRTTGDAGRVLRCKTSENLYVLRNIRKILEHPNSHTKLLTEAIGVVACLALDETGKEEIGSSPRVVKKLVSFLVAERAATPSNRVELAKSAVEALVMLTVDSTSIAWRILEELKPENVQQLVEMLSSDSTELRTMVAKLLGSLRVNSKPEHAHCNRTIDSQLPLNLEEWRTKQGALLESIVGLSVQICKSIQASDFADALRNENLAVEVFMPKL